MAPQTEKPGQDPESEGDDIGGGMTERDPGTARKLLSGVEDAPAQDAAKGTTAKKTPDEEGLDAAAIEPAINFEEKDE